MAKQNFLKDVYEKDQGVRNEATEKRNKDPLNKTLDYQIASDLMDVDAKNLIKIECYLKKYGYPPVFFETEAKQAPWLVIHHSATTKDRRRNFKYLKQGHESGALRENSFAFYLDRLYTLENGKRFDMGSRYKESERIKKLLEELYLDNKKGGL